MGDRAASAFTGRCSARYGVPRSTINGGRLRKGNTVSTSLVSEINSALREHIEKLLSATQDLVLLSEELKDDFQHCKKLRSKMGELGMGEGIMRQTEHILSAQKTLADDFERLHNDSMNTFVMADELWTRVQTADDVAKYNAAIDEWCSHMRDDVVVSLGEISAMLAKNTRILQNMIGRLNPMRYDSSNHPDLSSNVHDLLTRSDKVPFYAERVRNNLVEFTGYISGPATAIPHVELGESLEPGAGTSEAAVAVSAVDAVIEGVNVAARNADDVALVVNDLGSVAVLDDDVRQFADFAPFYEDMAARLRSLVEKTLSQLRGGVRADDYHRHEVEQTVRWLNDSVYEVGGHYFNAESLCDKLDDGDMRDHLVGVQSAINKLVGNVASAVHDMHKMLDILYN